MFDKKIIGTVSRETLDRAMAQGEAWQGRPLTVTDAAGAYVSPGFINLHIHGCAGADVMDAGEETLAVMSGFLVKTGVTSFLPTTMTCGFPAVYKALENIRRHMTVMVRRREEKEGAPAEGNGENPLPGAKVLGAYLEGPFISREYKGAQKEEDIVEADFSFIEDFADVIKVAVLAPETLRQEPETGLPDAGKVSQSAGTVLPGAGKVLQSAEAALPDAEAALPDVGTGLQGEGTKGCGAAKLREFIRCCREHHIIVSLGHSGADYDCAAQAVRAGATHATHLFNAMTGVHHRKPGLTGAVLDTGVTCELIADDLHVHPAVQRLAWRLKGAAELELVTDSMRACGLPEGVSELGGQTVRVRNGEARLADGTIAGSVVTMNRAMANFRRNTGASVPEVVRMVTENQAQELGLFEKIGSLCPGAAADITVFDEDFTVLRTFVDGREVYKNPDFR